MSTEDVPEDILDRKSKARRDIVKRIKEFDPEDFDDTPWSDPNVIMPIPGKQEKFLMSRADITFFAGGAGSAKTVGLVLDQLQHIHDPNFESVSFRISTKSLTGAGGLFSTKTTLYTRLGAEKRIADKMYKWKSGATSRYTHLEHGKATAEENHSGLEYSAIYFDELQYFDKDAFMFLLSRLRSNADMNSFIKATMNPVPREDKGGWIHEFIRGFYIDDYGYPIEENDGKIRYFVTRDDGTLAWGDTEEELKARYGFDCAPMSFCFINSLIIDNPVLCKQQPRYLSSLKNMGRVERERLLFSCWDASPKGTGYFQKEWVDVVDAKDVPRRKKTVRAWDLAASIKSEINNDPDSSAGVKISLCEDGFYYVESTIEFQDRPAGVLEKVTETADIDGRNCLISIPRDPGAGGEFAYMMFAKPLIHSGYRVKKSKTRKSKLERFMGFSNAAENGLVRVVKGDWNDKWVAQLDNFDPDRRKQHDDILDATSDAFNLLQSRKGAAEIKNFSPSSLTKPNAFSSIL